MYPRKLHRESESKGSTRRNVLLTLGGAGTLGLAGCLGSDGAPPDSDPTGDEGGSTSTPATTQSTGDGTAPVNLQAYPPNHHMDAFTSFAITFESLVLTDTGGEEVTIPVGETVNLASGSTATGIRVAEDLAVPAGDYETLDVHYSIDQAVTTDGGTAEIAFTSPGSENVVELHGAPSTVEESSPYVLQTHFGLTSEPWDLFTPTIVLGPGIPD